MDLYSDELCQLLLKNTREARDLSPLDVAIELCLYCMKTQIFNDGNKRTAVIFANFYLISQGGGLIVIPEKEVPEFRKLLAEHYEGKNTEKIAELMRTKY